MVKRECIVRPVFFVFVMVFPTRCFPHSLIFSGGFDATNRNYIE